MADGVVGHDGVVPRVHVASASVAAAPSDPLTRKLYDTISETARDGVSTSNILNIITYSMATVEKFRGVPGPQKRDMVLQVIRRVVNEHAPAEDRDAINSMIALFGPGVIDSLVSATKGQLNINAIAKKVRGCFASCCGGNEK